VIAQVSLDVEAHGIVEPAGLHYACAKTTLESITTTCGMSADFAVIDGYRCSGRRSPSAARLSRRVRAIEVEVLLGVVDEELH